MNKRKSEYPIHELLLNRWSPRSLSPDPIPDHELMALFEAAKWAPSSFNNQPWRFIYATHGSSTFIKLLQTMDPFNQAWAQHASVLVLVLSYKFFEKMGTPSPSHSFDAGAACQNMALQASVSGLALRLLEGFNKHNTRTIMNIPHDYAIEVLAAIGKPGDVTQLSEQLQKREQQSSRKTLSEIVFKDEFKEITTEK